MSLRLGKNSNRQHVPPMRSDGATTVIAIALVWFSAHIGGGFASGSTIYSYFINHGAACVWLPALSLAMIAFVYWWGWRHAAIHKVFDYRSFNESFYGRYSRAFSNLYEVLIVFVVVVGTSVAFATGASVLEGIAGVSYPVATSIVGAAIFLVCIFGSNVVRRASVVFSALMICALLLVYVPATAMNGDNIAAALAGMEALPKADGGFSGIVPALGMALMYGVYQASDVALYVQHMRVVKEPASVGKALVLSYVLNLAFIMLALFGLLTVAGTPGVRETSVPLLLVIDALPFAAPLKMVAGAFVAIACISTSVMFIGGMVKRLCVRFDGAAATEVAEDAFRPTRKGVLFTAICVAGCFLISQFGLLPLVQQGYSLLGYMAIPVVTVPYVVNFVWDRVRRRRNCSDADGEMPRQRCGDTEQA